MESSRTMSRSLCALLVGAAACNCGGSDGPDGDAGARPDVVLFVIDTLRSDRVSAYGYGRATTPVLDRLAREGALAEDVTAQCSWTLPSMVSMFQGRYVTSYRDAYLEDAPTIAESFRDAGYRTVGVVGNGLLAARNGFDRGFDHYEERRPAAGGPRGPAARTAQELFEDALGPLSRAFSRDGDGRRPPVFAYLHFMDPHDPYQHHPPLEEHLPTGAGAELFDLGHQRALFAAERPGAGTGTDAAWRGIAEEIARYDQEVRHADEYVGLVLDLLEQSGDLDEVLVAVVSDHGECLWEHRAPAEDREGKEAPRDYFFQTHGQLLYEEIVATPLILWGAGVPAGRRLRQPAENVDLYPTLLELAGLPLSDGLHGRSLTGALRGETLAPRDVFSAVLEERSVREVATGWKLIVPTEHFQVRGVRLYDLNADPEERENVADSHPDVVRRLERRLAEWVERHPTATTLGRPKDAQTQRDMKELGYAGDDDDDDDDG